MTVVLVHIPRNRKIPPHGYLALSLDETVKKSDSIEYGRGGEEGEGGRGNENGCQPEDAIIECASMPEA